MTFVCYDHSFRPLDLQYAHLSPEAIPHGLFGVFLDPMTYIGHQPPGGSTNYGGKKRGSDP